MARMKYTSNNLKSDSESESNENTMRTTRLSNRTNIPKSPRVVNFDEDESSSGSKKPTPRASDKLKKGIEVKNTDGQNGSKDVPTKENGTKITKKMSIPVLKISKLAITTKQSTPSDAPALEVKNGNEATPSRSRSVREKKIIDISKEHNKGDSKSDEEASNADSGEEIINNSGRPSRTSGSPQLRNRKRITSPHSSEGSINGDTKRRKSGRAGNITPSGKYVEIDSDSSNGETKKISKPTAIRDSRIDSRDSSPSSFDGNDSSDEDDILTDSDPPYGPKKSVRPKNLKRGRPTKKSPSQHRPASKRTPVKPSVDTIDIDEDYEDLKKEYITKKIQVLDLDLYLKQLEALQKEQALHLPASSFTVELTKKQKDRLK